MISDTIDNANTIAGSSPAAASPNYDFKTSTSPIAQNEPQSGRILSLEVKSDHRLK